MNPFEAYLRHVHIIKSTGASVAETSFYAPLSNLLDAIGKSLKPKVRAVITIANRGAGLPDGGLFAADQINKKDQNPMKGQLPSRGVVEVKGPAEDVKKIAGSDQVRRYVKEYGVVLVTNYRDFLLLGRDSLGNPILMERYTIAGDETSFWLAVSHPKNTCNEHGDRFCEFLRRVMLSVAPLTAPQDLAWFLASYARDAKSRVENHKDLSALDAIRGALEEALGMKFTGEKGDHFFRSTLVQTIFYGVFSAWVLWHREQPDRKDKFDWRIAEWSLTVPFIHTLYEQIATPSKLGALGLMEVLDWTGAVLNRVNRPAFFHKFQDEHAVQYFYEPFLLAFDPELRKDLGVWYTPPEIVEYQIARIDKVLREELDLPDGFADKKVIVLDPCCGTGAYLVEVLKTIAKTLKAKGGDALIASDLKKASMKRVFGFEILPAPFVVSHLQLGLMLHGLGAPLSAKKNERVGVYLTNSLTGWEPLKAIKQQAFGFMEELKRERDAAGKIKREAPVLVVLGNPPYNAFAGVSPEEEKGLVDPYKDGLNTLVQNGGWGIKKFNLDDLYIRFYRLAERRIAEMTGIGIVSIISNYSYLSDPSFVVMRKRFLNEFDKFWFDCMNGDSRETGKTTPDGKPDPSVFSTKNNREGIKVGTVISVIVRKAKRSKEPIVRFKHYWGAEKRKELLESLELQHFNASYLESKPCKENRFSFRPERVSTAYESWPKLIDLCLEGPFNGPIERRGNSLVTIEKDKIAALQEYLDPTKTDDEIDALAPAFMRSSGEFDAKKTRKKLKGVVLFNEQNIKGYPFKPFDLRHAYLDAAIQPLFSRPSPELLEHASVPGNSFFISRDTADKTPEGPPFYFSNSICDYDFLSGHARHFPVLLFRKRRGSLLPEPQSASFTLNLSPSALAYLKSLGIKKSVTNAAAKIWLHALAVGYSPAYLSENADGIRRDWPRIPLPRLRKSFEASFTLGCQIANLLDSEIDIPGITAGTLSPLFQTIGVLTKIGNGALDPEADDLALTAGWGHAGKDAITMPSKGHIVRRPFEKAELDSIILGIGRDPKRILTQLGPETCDVFLNDKAYWKNIPIKVWEYYIGGYQVLKKWLSYRERELIDRALTPEEARHVSCTARRLLAIILLSPRLDSNYEEVISEVY